MGTKARPEPSWIDRLKANGAAWLSATAITLGLGGIVATTKPPAPPSPSSARVTVPQDPVSPTGHYATFDAYLESVKCKLERGGYVPATRRICSPLFAAAAQSSQDPPQLQSPTIQTVYQPAQNINQTGHINANDASEILRMVNSITSGTLRESESAFNNLSTQLDNEQTSPEQKNYILSFLGGKDGYQRAYDNMLGRQADWYRSQFNSQDDLNTLTPQRLCETFRGMYSYNNLTTSRNNLRKQGQIDDGRQGLLEEEIAFYNRRIEQATDALDTRKISCDQFERHNHP